MVKARALQAGDSLAVIAPASPFIREEFDRGLEEIRQIGFVPTYDDSVFARQRYVAGAPELRAAAIHDAWRNPSVAGLIGVRGGYGSAQVLPLLDRDEARRARKPFIGYSDLTAILTFLTIGCDLVAFHGPMLARRLGHGPAGYDRDSLLKAVGERPYRLDRMVTQLRQTGLLARAAAIVIGELPHCDEPSGEPSARAVMADLLADFPGPVIIGFPSGHTSGPAMTLPFGVRCRVVARSQPKLVIEESAVD
jgi:muramoyltetrapeptide carboxypeptidase